MDINQKITGLGASTLINCPVEQDVYTGKETKYITFTYEDERPKLRGNNQVLGDTAYIQISYFVPKDYNYMTDKHKIRNYLEAKGFQVTSIRCWMENAVTGFQNVRHILFEANYTELRR